MQQRLEQRLRSIRHAVPNRRMPAAVQSLFLRLARLRCHFVHESAQFHARCGWIISVGAAKAEYSAASCVPGEFERQAESQPSAHRCRAPRPSTSQPRCRSRTRSIPIKSPKRRIRSTPRRPSPVTIGRATSACASCAPRRWPPPPSPCRRTFGPTMRPTRCRASTSITAPHRSSCSRRLTRLRCRPPTSATGSFRTSCSSARRRARPFRVRT